MSKRTLFRTIKGWILMLPFILLFGAFTLYPFVTTFFYSFTNKKLGSNRVVSWIGLLNYSDVLESKDFLSQIVPNSLVWVIVVSAGTVTLGLVLALLLERPLRGIGAFRTGIYIPVVIDWVVVSIVWSFLLQPDVGMGNSILISLGFAKSRFLNDPNIALMILIFIYIWKAMGYFAIFYLAALQDVPPHLTESATIDGANYLQILFKIKLPQIAPIFAVVVVMSWINALKTFDIFYVMTGGGPANATKTMIYYYYEQAFIFRDAGAGAAVSVMFTISVFIIISIQRFILAKMRGAEGSI